MQKNSPDISQENVRRMAQDPAMQQLLHSLSAADPQALHTAISQAKHGDLEAAGKTLSALLDNAQLREALRQLGR